MLRDETIISIWDLNQTYTFLTADTLKPLMKWLECSELLEVVVLEDRQWIEKIQANETKIFRPSARVRAFNWLRSVKQTSHQCMLTALNIINLLINRDILSSLKKAPVQFIVEVAEWTGFEQNVLWHMRLAVCLRENEHYDEALRHFENVLELDETMWMAKEGIAWTLAAREDYKKAIELGKVIDAIQEKLWSKHWRLRLTDSEYVTRAHRVATNHWIADWYSILKNSKSAVEHYKKALEIDMQNHVFEMDLDKIFEGYDMFDGLTRSKKKSDIKTNERSLPHQNHRFTL